MDDELRMDVLFHPRKMCTTIETQDARNVMHGLKLTARTSKQGLRRDLGTGPFPVATKMTERDGTGTVCRSPENDGIGRDGLGVDGAGQDEKSCMNHPVIFPSHGIVIIPALENFAVRD